MQVIVFCCLLMQIKKPDEYDCMFTCQIRSKCVYHPSSPSKSYAGLRILTSSNWEPSELLTSFGNDSFICPKAFKRYFREHVESALRCSQPKGKEIGMSSSTSQCGPNGRRDKPPPPAVVHVAGDSQTNEQTNKRTDKQINRRTSPSPEASAFATEA